ncbi:hypothetical protein KEJ51_06715 [Candidatus Bathyarchaeota archaeon]|nr:hypothetical protein [Candidatus Bathyarchaeota archaeon]MBS7629186.1 hypothetical protein [Candidatus Bathyarchaeota archaeon]
MSSEETRKRLADMKAYLERRISDLNREVVELSGFLEVVDELLAEKSFRRMEVPKLKSERGVKVEPSGPKEKIPILTPEGAGIGEITFDGNCLVATPAEGLRFSVDTPPLRAFLVSKVFEPMRARDAELCREGKLQVDRAFTYTIDQDGLCLKSIVVRNYGDERRLMELKNAIRWTFRRMYEKTSAE